MEKNDLHAPMFTNDEAARLHFESLRWQGGMPVCFHCGVIGDAALVEGKSHRPGLYYCRSCKGQFTATMGTIFEDSHIPMRKWLLAIHLKNSSKKGISATQLQRDLGLGSYRTAWFMAHRIREAMTGSASGPLGGEGKIVEADETYFGKVAPENVRTTTTAGRPFTKGGKTGGNNQRPIVALVERGGKAKVFHVGNANKETVSKIVRDNVDPASRLHTDESRIYSGIDSHTATHETVKHSVGEYARGDVNTNSAEGFFGVFKKGMTGVYQHCDEKYLGRYVAEFEFRHNTRAKLGVTDQERAALAVKGAVGKRLTLRQPKGQQTA